MKYKLSVVNHQSNILLKISINSVITEKNYITTCYIGNRQKDDKMGIFGRLFGDKTWQITVRKKRKVIDVSELIAICRERFIFYDLTAEDKKTELIWIRDADMEDGTMAFSDANDFITKLNRQRYAEYDDWRLPNEKELITLVNFYGKWDEQVNKISSKYYDWLEKNDGWNEFREVLKKIGFNNLREGFYWSSTTVSNSSGYGAMRIQLFNGLKEVGFFECSSTACSSTAYVWPVRSGQYELPQS